MRLCLRLCVKIWGFTSKLWNGSSLSGVDTSVPRATSGSGVCFMPRTPHRFSVLNSFLVFQDTDSLRFHGLATFYTVELTWELPRDNHCLPQVWHETSFNNRLFIYFSERTGAACFFVSRFRVRGLTVVAQTFFWDDAYSVFFVFFASGGIDGQTTYDPSSHKPAAMCETQTCKNILNSGGNTLSSRLWHLSVKWIMHQGM